MALEEYLSARLAHFLVLPILFQNDYDKNELLGMIHKNIEIKYPEYWLQIESARIFLETYFRKLRLPETGFNLQKSLDEKYFAFHLIRKLAYYNYFLECLERGVVKSKTQLLEDWERITAKLILSKQEQEAMKNVYSNILKIGENVSDIFSTLPLMNTEGKLLDTEEKKALINNSNIILDFWASWCQPCRKKMSQLNSDNVMINDKKYRIIYLSVDQDQNSWEGAVFSFLNKKNSFRITSRYNEFVEEFNIGLIPRYILIDQSNLVSSEFSY